MAHCLNAYYYYFILLVNIFLLYNEEAKKTEVKESHWVEHVNSKERLGKTRIEIVELKGLDGRKKCLCLLSHFSHFSFRH